MEIWHDTGDAPRRPRRVSPGETIDVVVGTWPIGVGQSVLVTWEVVAADGARREGATPAAWHHNDTVNSSWTAPLGPFAEGDEVTYTVQGASPDGEAHTPTFAFRVKPVLARSGRWGYRASEPEVLCQPYRTVSERQAVAVFFRDTDLSDGVGFRYGQYTDQEAAVQDFLQAVETKFVDRMDGDDDHVLTIVLDGENAWGGYPDDGRPFLHALYRRLASGPRFRTVTFSEYLLGNPGRGIRPHPLEGLAPVHALATGSWIDEPGSDAGVDLGTWIGEPEENAAWTLLGAARSTLTQVATATPEADRAHVSLMAAEGSDWFWWFGSDQESRNDASFDELFRAHLRGVYHALGVDTPAELDEAIVPHPVVWTFAHPVSRIGRRDQLTVRTNCPGRLTVRAGDGPERTTGLTPVGGVMAGARRFQATLGPFPPEAHALTFRFHCEHVGCPHDAPCCVGLSHAVTIGRAPATAP